MFTRAKLAAAVGGLPRSEREFRAFGRLLVSLKDAGWQLSARTARPRTAEGQPTPWWTYASVSWLALVLEPTHRVFEYGSGSSTIWLAERVAEVHSVEHDPAWFGSIESMLPPNASVTLVATLGDESSAPPGDPYTSAIGDVSGPFDVVVVDGMARNSCVELAVEKVADSGLIILDDGDRVAYRPSHDYLQSRGFGRIDFHGLVPGAGNFSMTCVFSRAFDSWARNLRPPTPTGF